MKKHRILKSLSFLLVAICFGFMVDKAAIIFPSVQDQKDVMAFSLVQNSEPKQVRNDYRNQWLTVVGELHQIEVSDEGTTMLFLKNHDMDLQLKCILKNELKPAQIDQLGFNKSLRLKGKYKQNAEEVFLEDCKIL